MLSPKVGVVITRSDRPRLDLSVGWVSSVPSLRPGDRMHSYPVFSDA